MEILVCNIGGMSTLIGDPPNIMIGGANPHLTFNDFIINLLPISLVILVMTVIFISIYFKNNLVAHVKSKKMLMELDEDEYIKDPFLMKKSLIIMIITLIGFIFHDRLGLEAPLIAVAGATLLMLWGVDDQGIEDALRAVEWVTIFFFIGLFVLVGGLVDTGIIQMMAFRTLEVTKSNVPLAAMMILWISGLASALIDNIPFVATMIPLIHDMGMGLGLDTDSPEMSALWWSLSIGACLGGNGTIIGSSANLIVVGLALREGYTFSFVDFLKIGFPLTMISLGIASVYLYFRYLVELM